MLLLSSSELFWDCTGECAALYTINTDLIVSTRTGESLKCGELQADITTFSSLKVIGNTSYIKMNDFQEVNMDEKLNLLVVAINKMNT